MLTEPNVTEPNGADSAEPRDPPWGRWIARAVVILTVTMAVYIGATAWADRGNLSHSLDQLSLGVLASALGLVVLGLVLRGVRWHYYSWLLDWGVPWIPSFAAFFASFAFTATPGKLGEAVKSILLRSRHDVPLAEGFGVLLVERLGDLICVLVLAAGGLALLSDALIYFVITAVVIAGITVVVGSRRIYGPLLVLVARLPKCAGFVARLLPMLDASRALLRPVPFLVGMGIGMVAWTCEAVAFHIVIREFGLPHIAFLESCSIYGISTLVGALSFLPGGIGSFEFVMGLLLKNQGLSVAQTVAPIAVFRFCTLWLSSLIGLAFVSGWLWLVGAGSPPPAAALASPDNAAPPERS